MTSEREQHEIQRPAPDTVAEPQAQPVPLPTAKAVEKIERRMARLFDAG